MTAAGFPHSDTPGSQLGCQLPRAYRRLQRPSSALDAKASTMRPCQLANTNTQQKQQRHTLQKTTPTPPPSQGATPTHRASAGDARVHYPEIKQQEATTPTRRITPPAVSDASDSQQRA